jgi:hypothetical protein
MSITNSGFYHHGVPFTERNTRTERIDRNEQNEENEHNELTEKNERYERHEHSTNYRSEPKRRSR